MEDDVDISDNETIRIPNADLELLRGVAAIARREDPADEIDDRPTDIDMNPLSWIT